MRGVFVSQIKFLKILAAWYSHLCEILHLTIKGVEFSTLGALNNQEVIQDGVFFLLAASFTTKTTQYYFFRRIQQILLILLPFAPSRFSASYIAMSRKDIKKLKSGEDFFAERG